MGNSDSTNHRVNPGERAGRNYIINQQLKKEKEQKDKEEIRKIAQKCVYSALKKLNLLTDENLYQINSKET